MKFGCTGNILKPEFETIFKEVYTFLTKNNHEVWLSDNVYIDRSSNTFRSIPQKSIDEIGKECDIILSIGGDGTILSTFRQVAQFSIPIFGIHIGGLGFLSESNQDNFIESLNAILSGNYITERRMALRLNINNNSEIAGFQCDVVGGKIIDVSGGVVEENGFMSSHSESTILSFSVTGKVFSRGGNQVLINIKIVPEDSYICIEDVILSDIDGNALKSTSFIDCFKP